MENKKAQGLSINTIILIILGIVVLVALIFGFTKGWEGIKEWISPSNNVAEIKSQCEVACATENKYDYCSKTREVKLEGTSLKDVNCYYLSVARVDLGINACSALGDCGITVQADPSAANTFCGANQGKLVYYKDTASKLVVSRCGSDGTLLAV
jgi:hypothetical protein